MRISTLVRFVEDKSLELYAQAKPVIAAHMAAAQQAQLAYQASLAPASKPAKRKAAKRSTKR